MSEIDCLAEDFILHRLLAQQALQLSNLPPRRFELAGRHDRVACAHSGLGSIALEPPPMKQLVGVDAMARATSDTDMPGS